MRLSATMQGKWVYVTIPDGFGWQVIPQRSAQGYQVRVYRGKGKDRQIVAMFHADQIIEENTVQFDYNHPENDRKVVNQALQGPSWATY